VEGRVALLPPSQPIETHQILKVAALAGPPPPR
jgi:hypothetical protein